MARHIVLENGSSVNIESVSIAYRENNPGHDSSDKASEYLYYLMISGLDRPMSITESDFNAFCEVVKNDGRDAKVLSQEISRLTVAIRNLYELLRARMR